MRNNWSTRYNRLKKHKESSLLTDKTMSTYSLKQITGSREKRCRSTARERWLTPAVRLGVHFALICKRLRNLKSFQCKIIYWSCQGARWPDTERSCWAYTPQPTSPLSSMVTSFGSGCLLFLYLTIFDAFLLSNVKWNAMVLMVRPPCQGKPWCSRQSGSSRWCSSSPAPTSTSMRSTFELTCSCFSSWRKMIIPSHAHGRP